MIYLEGQLLNIKTVENKKKGTKLTVVSILDKSERFSRVIDLADFDGHINGHREGQHVKVPINFRQVVNSDTGRAYLNFSLTGKAEAVGA